MSMLKTKSHQGRVEFNLHHNSKSKSHYNVVIDKDPSKLAQVLLDLYLDGFPIEEAYKIMIERIEKKDWLGF